MKIAPMASACQGHGGLKCEAMKLLLSSLALHPQDPRLALGRARELGFQGVEVLCEPPWHPRGWSPGLIRDIAEGRGDLVLSLHAPIADLNLLSPNPEARRLAEVELARAVLLAARLGAEALTLHLGRRSSGILEPAWDEAKAALRRLAGRAADLGVELCLENDPRTRDALLWDLEAFRELLAETGLKGTLDLGHAWTAHGEGTLGLLPGLSGMVHVIHIHDNHGTADEHLIPGDGSVDLRRALLALGEAPLWVLEVFSAGELPRGLSRLRELAGSL